MRIRGGAVAVLVLLFFISSCKKDNSGSKFGKVSFDGAYALIVSEKIEDLANPQIAKLYKVTESQALPETKFLTNDGVDLGSYYLPESIYGLNTDYFFVSLAVNNSTAYESHLVRVKDGKTSPISPEFRPMKFESGSWVPNYRVDAFKNANGAVFYGLSENKLLKLELSGSDNFSYRTIEIPGIASANFDVDTEGHAMVGANFIVAPGQVLTSSVYEEENTHISKAHQNGLYLVKQKDGELTVFQIYYKDNILHEDTVTRFENTGENWQFIGGYAFPGLSQTLVVFDRAVLQVKANGTQIFTMDHFNVRDIVSAAQSTAHLYANAIDTVNTVEVRKLLKITPLSPNLSNGDLFAPNTYDIKSLHVSPNDKVSFFGTRLADSKTVFGFFADAGETKIVVNNQKIKPRQIFALP